MPQPSRRCTARTRAGQPCRGWAVHGSDPPRCPSHGGQPAPAPGSESTMAGDTISGVIHDLAAKQQALSRLIDDGLASGELNTADLARLLSLHSQNAARLGRLLRDQQALSDPSADALSQAIDAALDELSERWGVAL